MKIDRVSKSQTIKAASVIKDVLEEEENKLLLPVNPTGIKTKNAYFQRLSLLKKFASKYNPDGTKDHEAGDEEEDKTRYKKFTDKKKMLLVEMKGFVLLIHEGTPEDKLALLKARIEEMTVDEKFPEELLSHPLLINAFNVEELTGILGRIIGEQQNSSEPITGESSFIDIKA